jgi:hypothetical protein
LLFVEVAFSEIVMFDDFVLTTFEGFVHSVLPVLPTVRFYVARVLFGFGAIVV